MILNDFEVRELIGQVECKHCGPGQVVGSYDAIKNLHVFCVKCDRIVVGNIDGFLVLPQDFPEGK